MTGIKTVTSTGSTDAAGQIPGSIDMQALDPRTRGKVQTYQNYLQQQSTTKSLLQQELNKLQQLQQANGSAHEIQSTKSKIKDLQNILTREQRTLQLLGEKPALQQVLEKAKKDQNYTVSEYIGKSVGAKAKNYKVYNPITGEDMPLTEGTYIIQPKNHVMAGKGRGRQIDQLDFLLDTYGGNPLEWTKEKGFGYVDDEYGESHYVELHWYQEPSAGKVRIKIKVQPDGRIYLDED